MTSDQGYWSLWDRGTWGTCHSRYLLRWDVSIDRNWVGIDSRENHWNCCTIKCHILRIKCTELDFGWGSATDPIGGSYLQCYPVAWFQGPTSKGREGCLSSTVARDRRLCSTDRQSFERHPQTPYYYFHLGRYMNQSQHADDAFTC